MKVSRTHIKSVTRFALALTCFAALFVMIAAPAAAQQRDPFDPLVSTGGVSDDTGTTTSSSTSGSSTSSSSSSDGAVEESSLPNTGSDMSQWLAVAYVLVAAGIGFIVITKTLTPEAKRR
jgi:LPXTG-motif cell wall-anchored protein